MVDPRIVQSCGKNIAFCYSTIDINQWHQCKLIHKVLYVLEHICQTAVTLHHVVTLMTQVTSQINPFLQLWFPFCYRL